MAGNPKSKDGPQHESATQLPQLAPDALQNLTKSIQEKLKQKNAVSSTTAPKSTKKKEASRVDKSHRQKVQAPVKESARRPQANGHATSMKEKPAGIPGQERGKKRLRDGQVKAQNSATKGKENVNRTKLGSRQAKSFEGKNDRIQEDIRELGGTEDDFDLIAGIRSDSEFEDGNEGDDKVFGGKLTKELQKMVQGNHESKGDKSIGKKGTVSGELKQKRAADVVSIKQGSQVVNLKSQRARPLAKGQSQLIFQPRSEWHAATLPTVPELSGATEGIPHDLCEQLHEHAKSLLETENKTYASTQRSASSAHQFYSTIMSTGTLSDKISALTLSVQESPLHNMKALEGLIGLARKRSRSQAVDVLGALKDLFGPGNLLPSDRKLKTFATQPGLFSTFDPTQYDWSPDDPLPEALGPIHLIVWAYEDWLKTMFFEVLKIIESWCNDEVAFARGKAVDYISQLLREKPEQEANLLRLLVNKLGDTDKKIASKTSFNILQLETTHPSMKSIIIGAVEADIIFRPGQSSHAKYYATITLNQTVLSGKEEPVARKLLDIYFGLFLKLLEKPEKQKAEGTGANTAILNKKGEIQGGGGASGKKALKKQAENEKAKTVDEDLREKMLSAVLTGVNRAIPFTTTNDDFFERHLDTLFRVTHSSNFNTSIQALMLIQQLQASNQHSADRFYRTMYESLLDPRLLTSSKQALYLNLLFRTLRSDLNLKRVKAFTKRLLQVVAMHQPAFTCAAIFLIRELEPAFPSLNPFISQPEESPSDDEESFHDVPDTPQSQPFTPADPSKPTHHVTYDGRKRDPLHANASTTTLWELSPFLGHYHPSVSLFASRLLSHDTMPPKPDLNLNTLIHFLDRFVYKNPKKSSTSATKGVSIMQPLLSSSAAGDKSGFLVSASSQKAKSEVPVNSKSWTQGAVVGADEVFFHKYFEAVGKGKAKAKGKKEKGKEKKKKGGDDEESKSDGGEEEEEEEIWKALVGSRPEIELDGEESEGFSDMDDEWDDGGSGEAESANEAVGSAPDIGDDDAEEEDDAFPDFDIDEEEDDGDDALLDSDAEVPSDLDAIFAQEAQGRTKGKRKAPDSTSGAGAGAGAGGESGEGESKRAKRRRVKNLPLFAGAEEYAAMLGD